MTTGAGLLLQYLVIALAVLGSAGYVVQRQWPAAVRRLRIACALPLLRGGRPPWLRKVAGWIAPPVRGGTDTCATGCGGCGPAPPVT